MGNQFTVNSVIAGSQIDPDVAMDAEGDFVIVWSGPGTGDLATTNAAGIITSTGGVFGQYYNSFGVPQGEFKVNEYTVGTQDHPAVAMDQNGDFVVTWNSYNNRTGTPDRYGVWARRYNYLRQPQPMSGLTEVANPAAGLNPGVLVNAPTRLSRRTPTWPWTATATSPSSGRATTATGPPRTSSDSSIADGTTRGNPFEVNTYTSAGQIEPRIAMDPTGDFAVVWSSFVQDGSGYGVYARRYDAATAVLGTEFRVNENSTKQRPLHDQLLAIPTGRCHGGQRPHGGYLEHRRPAARRHDIDIHARIYDAAPTPPRAAGSCEPGDRAPLGRVPHQRQPP